MTRDAHDEDRREPQGGSDPSPEKEEQPEEEPQHPGWLTLAQVFNSEDPFFEKFLYLLGYDYSSNIYVIKGDYLTIVDPGNDYTGFIDLFQLGYQPKDIKKIVLTHGHRDHCMGAFELLRAYPEITDGGGFELILHPESPGELKEVVKKFGCKVTEVQGGEILELSGLEWEVMYTPAHTTSPAKPHLPETSLYPTPWPSPTRMPAAAWTTTSLGSRSCSRKTLPTCSRGMGYPCPTWAIG